MELLFAPLWLVMAFPWLALVPASAFGACFARHRTRLATPRDRLSLLLPALLWLAYAPYEWLMLQWSKEVVAPIRIDLLVIGPLLYASTFVGVRAWVRARRDARATSATP